MYVHIHYKISVNNSTVTVGNANCVLRSQGQLSILMVPTIKWSYLPVL